MSTLIEDRAAALKAAQDIVAGAKGAERELNKDEVEQVEAKFAEVDKIDEQIKASEKSAATIQRLSGFQVNEPEPQSEVKDGPTDTPTGGIGDRFVKSAGMQSLRKQYGNAVADTKNPIHVEAKGIGGLDELGIGRKGLTTTTGQPTPSRLPGYRSTLLDEPFTFLDLVTTGTTDSSWIEYAQILSETNNADIVPEGELKPLSELATGKAEAKAHVYADGFDITNQTLADDGALATYMQSRIAWHVRNKVEDTLINGDTNSNVKGILNTTGVQQQAFDTDVITTLAAALQKVENVQVAPEAIVMNPADAWKLSLTKEAGVGFLMGNPLQQSLNPTPFGVRLVKSNRVAAGKFLVGNFSGVQLLLREALSVVAFNQHKDYAQRNMSYVRAELRALQFIYAPRELVYGSLSA